MYGGNDAREKPDLGLGAWLLVLVNDERIVYLPVSGNFVQRFAVATASARCSWQVAMAARC